MSRFAGFGPATFAYLGDLAANNRRDWFEANRDRYEAHWKTPALDFIAALAPGMASLSPALQAVPKLNASLRRINRDTRFSADKTPYEPWLHLIFWPGGPVNKGAGMHLVLRAEGVGWGAGRWALEGAALDRYRARVGDPVQRARLRAALATAGEVGCSLDPPALKSAPKGNNDPDAADLLRHKGIVARTREDAVMPEWIGTPEAVGRVLDLTRALLPLIAWLDAV